MTTDISSYKLPSDYVPMTLQMVFNAAWQAFIVENKPPAVTRNPRKEYYCSYFVNESNKCAIGLCLPEGHPATKKVCSVTVLQLSWPELFSDPSGKKYYILQRDLHDNLVDTTTGEWLHSLEYRKAEYIRVARRLSLTVPFA